MQEEKTRDAKDSVIYDVDFQKKKKKKKDE